MEDFDINDVPKALDDDFLDFDLVSRLERASVSDVYLNETSQLNLRLEDFNKIKKSNSKLISNSNESAQTAAKITKNIFDNTNSKLNMEIFNSINIGKD